MAGQSWEMIGLIAALAVWGGALACWLCRMLSRRLSALVSVAAAGRLRLLPLAVVVAAFVVYGGGKTTGYTVRFDANGGSGEMSDLVIEGDCVKNLPVNSFAAPGGRRFAGWSGSNGKRYDDGMLVFRLAPAGGTVVMSAIWE